MRPILHQRTKFRKDRSNCCGDMEIFVIFKMVAAAILDFQKFEILTVDQLQWSSVRHYFKSHQNRQTIAELRRFNSFFQNGGRAPSWFIGRLLGPPTTTT